MSVTSFDEWALLFSFWSSMLFLIGYTIASPWWRYKVGRAIAALDTCIVVTLFPGTLRDTFGIDPKISFFAWYGGFSLLLVGFTTLWRLWIIWSIQSSATPRHTEADDDERDGVAQSVEPSVS